MKLEIMNIATAKGITGLPGICYKLNKKSAVTGETRYDFFGSRKDDKNIDTRYKSASDQNRRFTKMYER